MENDEWIMASCIANSLPEALQQATTELVRWLERDYKLSANEAAIVAGTSIRYDIGRKAALYASFSIRELWVIDALRLTTRVFQEPATDGYRSASDFGPADRLTPLVGPQAFALRLDELELT